MQSLGYGDFRRGHPNMIKALGILSRDLVLVLAALTVAGIGLTSCADIEPQSNDSSSAGAVSSNDRARGQTEPTESPTPTESRTPKPEQLEQKIEEILARLAELSDAIDNASQELGAAKRDSEKFDRLVANTEAALREKTIPTSPAAIKARLADLERLQATLARASDSRRAKLPTEEQLRNFTAQMRSATAEIARLHDAGSWKNSQQQLALAKQRSKKASLRLEALQVDRAQLAGTLAEAGQFNLALGGKIQELSAHTAGFPTPTPVLSPTLTPVPTSTPVGTPVPENTPAPTSAPSVSPSATVSATPSVLTNTLDQILKSLPWGNIVYGVQKKIPLHSEIDAKLILSPTKTIQQLESETGSKLEKQMMGIEQQSAHVQISEKMRATLQSTDPQALTVVPVSSDTQLVSFQSDTSWRWKVRANKPGTYSLVFNLAAVLKVDGEPTERAVQTHTDSIEVSVGTGVWLIDFLKEYWQWLATTLLIPIAVYVYRTFIRKEGPPRPS